ncbi:MAG: sugar phosphate isomerase/epimerase family protein [Gemmataceae bacterium]
MKYVYFTKTLQALTVPQLIDFVKAAGLDGVDLAVRPGFPVTPANAATELPKAAKRFADAGQVIGLVTAPTSLTDPESKQAVALFEACGAAGVAHIKIGYFGYRAPFEACLKEGRARIDGFAKLAARTKVKACYHTHSGNNLGNNAASLRLLLEGADPHHIGAFVDTGHTAVNGGPAALELDTVRPWLSLVAIKDMQFTKGRGSKVVPVGGGVVQWADVAAGLKACKFNGTVSVHGEYGAKDLDERLALAKQELAALKKAFGG